MTTINMPEPRTIVNVLATGSRDFWHRPTIRTAFAAIMTATYWDHPDPYRFRLVEGECPTRIVTLDLPDAELLALGHDPHRFGRRVPASADAIAASVAREMGWEVVESQPGVRGFPAPWKTLGKRAGFHRNQQMVDYLTREGGVRVCVGFPTRLDPISQGTADCMERARVVGVRTWMAPLGMGSDMEEAA